MWVVLWRVSSRDNICTKSRHIWKWLTLWLQLIKSIGNILGGFRGPVKGLPSSATSLSKRIDRNRIWLFRLPGLILILSLRIFPSLVIQCRLSSFPKFHNFCHFSNENDPSWLFLQIRFQCNTKMLTCDPNPHSRSRRCKPGTLTLSSSSPSSTKSWDTGTSSSTKTTKFSFSFCCFVDAWINLHQLKKEKSLCDEKKKFKLKI